MRKKSSRKSVQGPSYRRRPLAAHTVHACMDWSYRLIWLNDFHYCQFEERVFAAHVYERISRNFSNDRCCNWWFSNWLRVYLSNAFGLSLPELARGTQTHFRGTKTWFSRTKCGLNKKKIELNSFEVSWDIFSWCEPVVCGHHLCQSEWSYRYGHWRLDGRLYMIVMDGVCGVNDWWRRRYRTENRFHVDIVDVGIIFDATCRHGFFFPTTAPPVRSV